MRNKIEKFIENLNPTYVLIFCALTAVVLFVYTLITLQY